jgi:hypothetical protein
MKKTTVLATFASILVACGESAEKEGVPPSATANIEREASVKSLLYNPETQLYIWKPDYDYTKKQNIAATNDIRNVDSLIKGLNERTENVFLQKHSLRGDTIYTFIEDSKYLTEQMGSTGAELYIADVVLNLTEAPGVNVVSIKMEAGSHAETGTFTKRNFIKYKTLKE